MSSGALRNAQPGQPVAVRFRDGSMHCMTKVPNPTGRTRFKGQFVCNSMCNLPTKRPSRRCGYAGAQMGYGGGGYQQPRPMLPYQGQGVYNYLQ
jgi:hypothetical protein